MNNTGGHTSHAEFLLERFPDGLKQAFLAWQDLDSADRHVFDSPFEMDVYVNPEELEAKKYAIKALEFKKAANVADNNSDNYVLLSLVLSMVLFFSGICGVLDSYSNQRILIGVAALIFLTALVFVFTMPVVF